MPLSVNSPNEEIEALRKQWSVLEALLGGTPAMRAAGQSLLPRWPNEEQEGYEARLKTATLMPAYRRTVSVMSGKPFSKALALEDAPRQIEDLAEDIDLQGVSLHSFAAEMFSETVGYGLGGVLVEYPRIGPAPQGVRTVAQVEAAGLRPYWVRVMHNQILGWRTGMVNGRMGLTQLRLLESVEQEDGDYGVTYVPQVRVLRPGSWETYQPTSNGKAWTRVDAGLTSLPEVPFVPFYGLRRAFMCGAPPLLDLAYLNIKHWQSQSDQDTITHVARVPILAMIGADDAALTVGAASAVKLPIGAEMKYVEHSGAAIEAGVASLAALEEQMIQTGAELLVQKPGQRTATEDANDAEGNKCDLQRMAENYTDALNQALWYTAQYIRQPTGGRVQLFNDYGAATLSDASATLVKDLNMAGLISRETTIDELKRRGVLAATVDAATEAAKVAEEGPALGLMGADDEPGVPAAA